MFYFVKLGGCHMDGNENLFLFPPWHGFLFLNFVNNDATSSSKLYWKDQSMQKKKKKPRWESLEDSKYKYFEYMLWQNTLPIQET
jgi:hypothetical protein